MKTITTQSILLALILSFSLLFTSCNKPEPTDTLVLHLIDLTAMNSSQPEIMVEDLLRVTHIDEHPENGIEYKVTLIDDVSVNKEYSARLEPSSELIPNAFTRKEEIQAFKHEVQTFLNHIYKATKPSYQSTNLHLPLAKKVKEYQSDQRNKLMLVQSDMIENSRALSFEREQKNLQKNPEDYYDRLENIHPLASLAEYEVVLLYQPETSNNEQYISSANVFAGLFRSKGAKVTLKANL